MTQSFRDDLHPPPLSDAVHFTRNKRKISKPKQHKIIVVCEKMHHTSVKTTGSKSPIKTGFLLFYTICAFAPRQINAASQAIWRWCMQEHSGYRSRFECRRVIYSPSSIIKTTTLCVSSNIYERNHPTLLGNGQTLEWQRRIRGMYIHPSKLGPNSSRHGTRDKVGLSPSTTSLAKFTRANLQFTFDQRHTHTA